MVPRLCRPPTLATFVLSMVTVLVALACSERITYTLTVTATGDGTVTPDGTTTQYESDEVTLRASWSDATHSFDGWGGECSGTASTCLLTMDANKSVTATFTALPLRYDTLDITGAVATGGSYAFLVTAGDPASAIDNFGYSFPAAAELRIHPTDASGKSRATFYDTVQVGDTFDYWTNNPYCGFRFSVTSAVTAATGGTAYGTFGLESVASPLGWCEEGVDDPGAARDVEFSWGPRPGWPGVDGVRVMIPGEPVDAGTYRVNPSFPYVIDVPASIEILAKGFVILALAPDTPAPSVSTHILPLQDVDTGAVLSIDAETGLEAERFGTTPAVDAMFDQIIASIRTVD